MQAKHARRAPSSRAKAAGRESFQPRRERRRIVAWRRAGHHRPQQRSRKPDPTHLLRRRADGQRAGVVLGNFGAGAWASTSWPSRECSTAKIKAAIAAAVMLATAACGAAEFVAKVKPFGLDFNLPGQIRSIFEPILRSFTQPFRINLADSNPVAPKTTLVAARRQHSFAATDIRDDPEPADRRPL